MINIQRKVYHQWAEFYFPAQNTYCVKNRSRYQLAKQMKAFQLVEQPTGMQQTSRFASYFYGGK